MIEILSDAKFSKHEYFREKSYILRILEERKNQEHTTGETQPLVNNQKSYDI